MANYEKTIIKVCRKKHRIDFWIGIGMFNLDNSCNRDNGIGFYASDYLDKNMMMGLAIVKSNLFLMHDDRRNENYSNR